MKHFLHGAALPLCINNMERKFNVLSLGHRYNTNEDADVLHTVISYSCTIISTKNLRLKNIRMVIMFSDGLRLLTLFGLATFTEFLFLSYDQKYCT